jgi:hypothetical protein
MHASDVTPDVAAKANDLYWTSEDSVNQIAEHLELSKGALYGAIEPFGSGLGCPLCGDEVGYSNRTARERKQLGCSTCDWDGSPDETIGLSKPDEDPTETRRRERTPPVRPATEEHAATQRRPMGIDDDASANGGTVTVPPRPVIVPPMGTIAKGALIGGAIGLALVLLTRRR